MTLKRENIKRIIFVLVIIILFLALTGCGTDMDDQPLDKFTDEGNLLNYIFVYPIGWIMSTIGNWFNGNYGVAIIITTVIVRFGAWPIYAGQTNMSLNMQLAKPDLDKLNAKYLGKDDPESQQRKAMEMREIYKKHDVSFKSCLSAPIQMGLFFGLTRAMRRIAIEGGALSLTNVQFLGFDLRGSLWSNEFGVGNQIFTGVLVILVALSSVGHQLFVSKRAKIDHSSTSPVNPAQNETSAMMQKSLKMMVYILPLGIAFLAAGNTAYALYYTVGNTCSMITMFINQRVRAKKLSAAKESRENGVDIIDGEKPSQPKNDIYESQPFTQTNDVVVVDDNQTVVTNKKNNDDIIDIE